jgi:hypothetical protein
VSTNSSLAIFVSMDRDSWLTIAVALFAFVPVVASVRMYFHAKTDRLLSEMFEKLRNSGGASRHGEPDEVPSQAIATSKQVDYLIHDALNDSKNIILKRDGSS